MEAQRVVVIQDASREVSSSTIRWALHGLSLKPGDKLTFLAVIHQVKTPIRYLSWEAESSVSILVFISRKEGKGRKTIN